MFRNLLGAAEGALIRAAASTQPFDCFLTLMDMSRTIRLALLVIGSLALEIFVAAQAPEPQIYSTPPVMFRSVPVYPPIAAAARATGTVRVNVTVAPDGSVASAQSVDGHALLRRAAEVSSRDWQFVPATDGGVRLVQLVFTFRLLSKPTETDVAATFVTPYHVEISRAPNIITDPPFTLRRKRSTRRHRSNKTAQSNKSLDASGGSVFLK